MPDVIAHGMLSMAWLARVLTDWVPQTALREYSVRFAAMTQVGERITCAGRVTELFEVNGERRARLEPADHQPAMASGIKSGAAYGRRGDFL